MGTWLAFEGEAERAERLPSNLLAEFLASVDHDERELESGFRVRKTRFHFMDEGMLVHLMALVVSIPVEKEILRDVSRFGSCQPVESFWSQRFSRIGEGGFLIDEADGLSGKPEIVQVSSAVINADYTASSTSSMRRTPTRRDSMATSLPYSCRKKRSTRWGAVKEC